MVIVVPSRLPPQVRRIILCASEARTFSCWKRKVRCQYGRYRLWRKRQNGLATVNGTDGLPLVQLIASATEAKIGAGQKDGRPGHLQMYNGDGQLTVDLNTADATLTLELRASTER